MGITFENLKEACLVTGLFFTLLSCSSVSEKNITETPFSSVKDLFALQLDSAAFYMDLLIDSTSEPNMQTSWMSSRKFFKQSEPIYAFLDVNNYKTLNQPNLLQVDEEDKTNIRIKEPQGYQVLEELIFNDEVDTSAIRKKAAFVSSRLKFQRQNIDMSRLKPYHFLWMYRNALIRIAFTGITGYDSPVLANSLQESKFVIQSLRQNLAFFKNKFSDVGLFQEWIHELALSETSLSADFDSFDRFEYLKRRLSNQLVLWNKTVSDWRVEFPLEMAIKNDASSLFAYDSYNQKFFSSRNSTATDPRTVALGEKLFYDKSLSLEGNMSCSSCHKAELAFTDGMTKSIGSDGKSVKRNAPTLMYAGFQKGYFYDKRSGSLEGQIINVVNAANEFHTNLSQLTNELAESNEYQRLFDSTYADGITERNIRNAIANYVRSLAPFSSKFDRNINGLEESLTKAEIDGFNLFMGKATCATCHFPPFFNGTIPPDFKETELESLGVPNSASNEKLDDDMGRHDIFGTEERKRFFKTPTVRNIALTSPYMHNGAYNTLEQVMGFYEAGGGAGLGFDLPLQTLPADSLGLTDQEVEAIIAFMKTLTDPTQY